MVSLAKLLASVRLARRFLGHDHRFHRILVRQLRVVVHYLLGQIRVHSAFNNLFPLLPDLLVWNLRCAPFYCFYKFFFVRALGNLEGFLNNVVSIRIPD